MLIGVGLSSSAAVAILHQYYPELLSLRDATLYMLAQHQQEFDPVVYRRCKYVVSENNHVEAACADLEQGDMKAFGERMYASHAGLQHDYEVSCPELDFQVEQAKQSEAVLGARMMGGDFGGCTINIVKVDALDDFVQQMDQAYQQQFGIQLKPLHHLAYG